MNAKARHASPIRLDGSLLALVWLLATAAASGADGPPRAGQDSPLPSPSSTAARTWTAIDGLPNNTVTAVTQTTDGYLWLGTRRGLARFDGVRLVVFDRWTHPDWTSDTVTALAASGDGGLWVGMSEGGLLRLHGGVFAHLPLPSRTVRSLHEARDGTLWVGMDRGLARVRRPDLIEVVASFDEIYVHAIEEAPDGTLWLGTSVGLYVQRGNGFARVDPPAGVPPGDEIYAVRRAADQAIWVGTERGRLYRLSGSGATLVADEPGPIRSILEDHHGVIWVAGEHGVKYVDEARLQWAPGEHAAVQRADVLFEDREGTVWVGRRFGGLMRLTAGQATSIGHDLEHPSALSVLEDRRGVIWFGTAGAGLGRLEDGELTSLATCESPAPDSVGPILEDRRGRLWFGPQAGNALCWIESGRIRSMPVAGVAVSLHEDPGGALWVGTLADGLYRLSKGRLSHWSTRDGLPSRAVRAMADDGRGGLWLGTPRGLVRFSGRPGETYTVADGLRSNRVMALYQEPEGPLWIGTSRGGLARFEHGRFTNYGTDQGLCDDQVLAILDDRLGNLWFSSERGVFRASKAQLNEVAAGRRDRVACTAFGRGDGMSSEQCNGGIQPSGWRARDGRLWFPTVAGLVVIDPAAAGSGNQVPPPVHIETVEADGHAIPLAESSRLPAGTRRVEIDYTALSLVAPEKMQFRYRLSGFDGEWVEGGTRRRVSYVGLPPGRYRFEVIASNNDGVWNEAGDQWAFRIDPYFHQTAWFYGLMALAVASAALWLHLLRVRSLRLRSAVLTERAHLSHEIHDHVSQIMTGIVLQLDAASQTLSQNADASRPYITRAGRLARECIEETRLILRTLGDSAIREPRKNARLDDAIAASATPLLEGTGIRLRVRTSGVPFTPPPVARHEVLRVAQEAVTNAVRHGAARNIDILVAFGPRGVSLTVEDDGTGFDVETVRDGHAGLGLKGMAERVAEVRGTFEVRSRPGRGTTVAAFIPVKSAG
jgi:ligand-binding sensor domain-containing protein/signal transduction histidine kinase